jgi:predicted  nucleic acid-binding Zn-ribbon protein
MGQNLISGCHKCKKQIFHFRNEENKTILDFYRKHKDCAKNDINNVQTVMDNNGTDQDWASSNGYENDELQQ